MTMKSLIKKEIQEREEYIQDQQALLTIWRKAPETNRSKIAQARKNIVEARKVIKLKTTQLEELENPSPPPQHQNQLTIFGDLDENSRMLSRAAGMTVEDANGLSKLIPDKVHKPEALDELQNKKKKNRTQNETVLAFFQNAPARMYTPWDVVRGLGWPERRITSVRRAITDLTGAGFLVKCEHQRREADGELNHVWKLKMA